MTEFPRSWVEIDLGAFRHNIAALRSALPSKTKLALVAKADGYGHGLVPISRTAASAGVDTIAVATVPEGIVLREAEIDVPVMVLAPSLAMEAEQAVFYGLRMLVESYEAAKALSDAAAKQDVTALVHLKIDTGMSRFGVQVENAADVAGKIAALPNVILEGAATHFSNSGKEPEYTAWQFEQFQRALCEIEDKGIHIAVRHCANSGAIVKFPAAFMDMARVGILAYGISHVGETDIDLKPVLTWRARIMAIRELPKGTKVSYNLTYETDRHSRIATLGVGYGDGYHRFLGNRGSVYLHGKLAPIRGVICMDQLMIDITEIPEAQIGNPAGLIEGPIRAEVLSEIVGTTPHEITTRIMSRVPRKYIGL